MNTQQAKQTYWQKHIHAWRASGQTQVGYCRRHQLDAKRLAYWLKREKAGHVTLVPVRVAAEGSGEIALHGPGGWHLHLPDSTSAEWLADLMRRLS